MLQIKHTKKYAAVGMMVLFLWMAGGTMLLQSTILEDLVAPEWVEGAVNSSLTLAMLLFAICLVKLFRKRPLLQASDRGLSLMLPPKNKGVIPWNYITQLTVAEDRRTVLVYLQGLWDIPDGCAERFDIQTDASGRCMIPLELRHRAGNPERVCEQMQQWQLQFEGEVPSQRPPEEEEVVRRRIAAAQKHGITATLMPLYFIRLKFWILLVAAYLLSAGCLTAVTQLSASWALIALLLLGLLLRHLLIKTIATLEQRREDCEQRAAGL